MPGMGMSELVLVLFMMAGGVAPEPVRWFGKIAITSGAPLGMLAVARVSRELSGPVGIMPEPPPPPAPPLKVPPPPKAPPPSKKKAL